MTHPFLRYWCWVFLLVALCSGEQSWAGSIEDYLAQQGITGSSSALSLGQKAKIDAQNFSKLGRGLHEIQQFQQENQRRFKRFKWDLISAGFDVVHALLTKGITDALIQVAASLADAFVEYGVPYIAGVVCAVLGTPALGVVCRWLAHQIIDGLALGELAEARLKQNIRHLIQARENQQRPALSQQPSANTDVYAGDIVIQARTGRVNTIASGASTAVTEIGVARGGGVNINVSVGDVNTIAKNASYAYSGIGIANADGGKIDVNINGVVNTQAENHSSAVTQVGQANGENSRISVGVQGDINTIANDRSTAVANIGVAEGEHSRLYVNVSDDVNTFADDASSAQANVGVSDGGRVNVYVKGVNTIADDGSTATNNIGVSNGRNAAVAVGGDVTTVAKRGNDASTSIGVNTSVSVAGKVINHGGDLEIGGSCAARRDGQCCIEVHRNYCVLFKVPPMKHGRCPPRFERWGAWCYLYSDKKHSIQR